MLRMSEKIMFSGESVIDEKVVCIYSASIDAENPEKMNISRVHNDKEAYKANRDECRTDFAAFEDAVFAEQAHLIQMREPVTGEG